MVTIPQTLAAVEVPQPPGPDELIAEDGIPLETNWHRLAMNLLIESVCWHLRARTDFFCGGNMFIYFNAQRARNRDFRGPDFFYVSGVPLDRERPWYAVWDEDRRPEVIIELTSPSTTDEDHGPKFQVYEQIFRTPEYYIYDRETNRLEGWRLSGNGSRDGYRPLVPDERGWLRCAELGLWLGTWRGPYLDGVDRTFPRFFEDNGALVLTKGEAEEQRAEAEKQRAEAEKQRAEAEKRRAEAEKRRAEEAERAREADRARADAAELELRRLRAEVDALRRQNH